MQKTAQHDINQAIALHEKFLLNTTDGKRLNLSESNLSYSDLSHANLSYSDLSKAILAYSNLSYSNLSYSNLSYSDLSKANLRGANIHGAEGIVSFGPVGRAKRIGYAVKHTSLCMVQLGCFWGPEAKALEAIELKYGPNSIYAALMVAACATLKEPAL